MPHSQTDFTWDLKDFYSKFNRWNRRMMSRFNTWARQSAQEMEDYARANARWRDRTGNLRRTLKGSYEHDGSLYTIKLEHGMPYGYWLENYFYGRYAILEEARAAVAPRALENLRDVIEGGW